MKQTQPLTKREYEITSLAARGLTSRAIAEFLVISKRTVDTHLAHAYPKLGVQNKTQLASYFLKVGDPEFYLSAEKGNHHIDPSLVEKEPPRVQYFGYEEVRDRLKAENKIIESSCAKTVTYKGTSKSIKGWAREFNLSVQCLYVRLFVLGWSVEKALETPIQLRSCSKHVITYKGEEKTLKEWSDKLGIAVNSLYCRLFVLGWSVEKAIETPLRKWQTD